MVRNNIILEFRGLGFRLYGSFCGVPIRAYWRGISEL